MKIDSRYNWFMYGVVICIIALERPPLLFLTILIVVNIIVSLSSKKLLGAGDTESLGWCMLGLGVIGLPKLYIFLMFFVIFILVYHVSKIVYDIHGKTPGMIVVFGSFLVSVIVLV